MNNIFAVSIILFISINIVQAKSYENYEVSTVSEALGALCGADLQIGLQAFEYRDQGESKESQIRAIGNLEIPRQKRIMKFSINDAYLHAELGKKIYAFYRMEICYQQLSGKNIPQTLSKEYGLYKDIILKEKSINIGGSEYSWEEFTSIAELSDIKITNKTNSTVRLLYNGAQIKINDVTIKIYNTINNYKKLVSIIESKLG